MKEFYDKSGIIFHTTVLAPNEWGSRRQNRNILKRLKISQVEKKDWKEDLLHFLMMYISISHFVTGRMPSELFYDRQFQKQKYHRI